MVLSEAIHSNIDGCLADFGFNRPAGPFLAYDHTGRLVSTIYMVPLKDIDEHTKFTDLGAAGQPVDHVDLYYNAGHPGVAMPHYHVVLWHVPKSDETAVAK